MSEVVLDKDGLAKRREPVSLKIKDIELGDGWPCHSDILERHKEIENLSPVVLKVQAPLVFAIDAPWGAGKSTFIKLWQHYLETPHDNFVSLYFNAWENDFSDDPLLPMLAEFENWLSSDDGKVKEYWEKTKKLLPGLLKRTGVVAAKAATFGGLDLEKEYEKLAADFVGDVSNDLISGFNCQKDILKQFKENLGKLTMALPKGQNNLIVFVDELDRCRPTYAIETLERIKHLFDIPNIVFVLAINKEQLSKSIQGVYGSNFDGMNYLKRFIDMEYSLADSSIQNIVRYSLRRSELIKAIDIRKDSNRLLESIEISLTHICTNFDYKIRDIQQITSRLNLVLRAVKDNVGVVALLAPFLIVLRHENHQLYKRYVKGELVANDVIEYLLGINLKSNKIPTGSGVIMGWIIKATYDPLTETKLESLIEPWIEKREQLEQKSDEFREIGRIFTVLESDINDYSFSVDERISKSAFEAIEFIEKISI